jgi:hypothetical protein
MILASVKDLVKVMFLAQKTLAGQTLQMVVFQGFVRALLALVPAFPFPVHPFQASVQATGFHPSYRHLLGLVLF